MEYVVDGSNSRYERKYKKLAGGIELTAKHSLQHGLSDLDCTFPRFTSHTRIADVCWLSAQLYAIQRHPATILR